MDVSSNLGWVVLFARGRREDESNIMPGLPRTLITAMSWQPVKCQGLTAIRSPELQLYVQGVP